jgi:hypothetical protein
VSKRCGDAQRARCAGLAWACQGNKRVPLSAACGPLAACGGRRPPAIVFLPAKLGPGPPPDCAPLQSDPVRAAAGRRGALLLLQLLLLQEAHREGQGGANPGPGDAGRAAGAARARATEEVDQGARGRLGASGRWGIGVKNVRPSAPAGIISSSKQCPSISTRKHPPPPTHTGCGHLLKGLPVHPHSRRPPLVAPHCLLPRGDRRGLPGPAAARRRAPPRRRRRRRRRRRERRRRRRRHVGVFGGGGGRLPGWLAGGRRRRAGGPHRGGPHRGGPHRGGPHRGGPHRGGPHRGGPHRGGRRRRRRRRQGPLRRGKGPHAAAADPAP